MILQDSMEAEREFSQSKIKSHLKGMIAILKADADLPPLGTSHPAH